MSSFQNFSYSGIAKVQILRSASASQLFWTFRYHFGSPLQEKQLTKIADQPPLIGKGNCHWRNTGSWLRNGRDLIRKVPEAFVAWIKPVDLRTKSWLEDPGDFVPPMKNSTLAYTNGQYRRNCIRIRIFCIKVKSWIQISFKLVRIWNTAEVTAPPPKNIKY